MTKIIGEIKEEIIVNKINVAIVDDNERMLTLLENILNEDSDISVIGKGGDGLQALDLIHKKEPDVVLLDLIMPVSYTHLDVYKRQAKKIRREKSNESKRRSREQKRIACMNCPQKMTD